MSDENAASPEQSENPPADSAPKARRISNPRPKKTAKAAQAAEPAAEAPVAVPVEVTLPVEAPEEPAPRNDWPEPDAPSTGGSSQSEGGKRKRRRKKGKGGGNSQNAPAQAEAEPAGESTEAAAPQHGHQGQQNRPQHPPRPKFDAELLAKFAWKIYLSEVSEEGVALIGDNDAKELSRRCFRLAEIFLEEQSRRR